MSSIDDFEQTVSVLDELPEETVTSNDPIGVTFASGIHESDLFSFLARAKGLAGDLG